ncbi:hypothetical protein C8R47DRAFT_1124134 [Mycena vitilis]|nr:hypothetical protein C8R47DRAFT_1124134 [Mycena vitilis]
MDVAPPPNQVNVTPIARSGIRPETRSRVIEILSGSANGCLQELGYSPGILEQNRILTDQVAKLHERNKLLLSDNTKLKAYSEELKRRAAKYQEENVGLYDDNVKLVADSNALRTDCDSLRSILAETQGMERAEILVQYSLLRNQYADAVDQLRRLTRPESNAASPQPIASGSHPPREVRPIMLSSQSQQHQQHQQQHQHQQPRRVSAPQPQSIPSPSYVSQPHQHQNVPQPQQHHNVPQPHIPQPRPLPGSSVQPHIPQPRPYPGQHQPQRPTIRTPAQMHMQMASSQGVPNISGQGRSNSHSGAQHGSPLYGSPMQTPTSAPPEYAVYGETPSAPPAGYGHFALNGERANAGSGAASNAYYRPTSAASGSGSNAHYRPTSAGASAGASASTGHRTPTFPPTPPMSALPLNLQNFTSPVQQHPQPPGPPRSASASSSGQGQQFVVPVAPAAAPVAVPVPVPVTLAPPMEGMYPWGPQLQTRTQEEAPVAEMQDVQEEEVVPDMLDIQDGSAPQDAGSPPEAHEAVTPPLDAPPAVALAPDEEAPEPEVKMEVVDSDDGPDELEDDDDEDEDGNEVGYIEVGPDGLRTVRDCVAAVFDPDEDPDVCRFCKARYDADTGNGVPSAPPPRMAGASLEQRAEHCQTEHEFAWDLLRRNTEA